MSLNFFTQHFSQPFIPSTDMSLHSIKKDLQLKKQRELNDLNEISEDV